MKKILFLLIWLSIFFLGPLTIYLNYPIDKLFISQSSIANTAQRFLGLIAFSLLFIQVLLGFWMERAKKYFGDWIYKFHIIHGIFIYFLIILHGFSQVYFTYIVFQRFDPFYAFIDVCVLCPSRNDFYINFGRIGFWFITLAVFAGLFRGFNLWMRKNWRNFHYLNYAAFLIIGIHAFFIGTDTAYFPFKAFHILGMTLVLLISIYKIFEVVKTKLIK